MLMVNVRGVMPTPVIVARNRQATLRCTHMPVFNKRVATVMLVDFRGALRIRAAVVSLRWRAAMRDTHVTVFIKQVSPVLLVDFPGASLTTVVVLSLCRGIHWQ